MNEPPYRDWIVRCACGAEYTPKARTEPTECYECGSEGVDSELLHTKVKP